MIFRICKDPANPYVMINRALAQSPNLSAKAKGIIFYLLSLPDNWQIYEIELVRHFKDGRDSIRAGLKELITVGYIKRNQRRAESGHFAGYEYQVFEIPQQVTVVGLSDNGESPTTNRYLTKEQGQELFNDMVNQEQRQERFNELQEAMLTKDLQRVH